MPCKFLREENLLRVGASMLKTYSPEIGPGASCWPWGGFGKHRFPPMEIQGNEPSNKESWGLI